MEGDILISTGNMMRGFALWDEQFRKNPAGFTAVVERILKGESPAEYGKSCADYFRSLLIETR